MPIRASLRHPAVHLLLRGATLALLLATLMRWLPGGWSVPDHLRIGLLWTALPLGLAALWLRRPLLLLPVLAASLVNASLVLPSLLPRSPLPGQPVTLLHANVWQHNPSMDGFVALARDQTADVVVVLERYHFQGYGWADALMDRYPHRLTCEEADCGNSILSRWPLERLGVVTSPWHDRPDNPSYLAARVHRPAGAFTLVTAHLGQPFDQAIQGAQADWLVARLKELPGPLILSGDFNAAPWSPLMARIMTAGGLARLSTTGPTWPSSALLIGIPIDHVLGDAGARDARVLDGIGSDHRPILVTFTLAAD
ncbi:MAG: endonuclease/exonuclease/phosphatase family protein [Niveispirillum sp.]|uniref:endonuclease/exonuclease/phosphatase family protein n=1 Tax=Niveispirillum sp. TaxID=1917217 RepID=UPI003BA4E616